MDDDDMYSRNTSVLAVRGMQFLKKLLYRADTGILSSNASVHAVRGQCFSQMMQRG